MSKFPISLLCVLLLCFTGRSMAGDVIIRGITIRSLPSIADSSTTVIPFSLAGNLIVVQGKAGEREGNFILDTGAPYLILNLTYFRNMKLLPAKESEQGGVTGSMKADHAMVDSFRIGAMKYERMEADLINLGHIENTKGIRILGLLGMQLFERCEMIVDYDDQLIYLHRISKKENDDYRHALLADTTLYYVLPITLKQNKILVAGEMAGRKMLFIMDSGAESNVLDSRLPNRVFEQVNITGRVLMNGTGAKQQEVLQGDLKEVKVGNQKLSGLPVIITNLEKMCFSYDECLDGMLGFDFLSKHRIGFNFVKREMYLWKN